MYAKLTFMIVAGEPSGDTHAAKLVRALREKEPQASFFGCAGPQMRAAGVEATVKADDLAIVGIPEIARALPIFIRAFRRLKREAARRRPDAAVLVDFPDFNLKLAKSLKKLGIKVVYYISPQLWGWRKYRRRTIRAHVDLLLTILPFEKAWYDGHGIKNVEYVGSPLVREVHAQVSKEQFREKHHLDLERPLIALLPGSRHKELVRILPIMFQTAALMLRTHPELQFVVALAPTRHAGEVEDAFRNSGIAAAELPFSVVKDETYDALHAADAAAVTSGTATLETGIIGTPMAIVYRTSTFNYKLLRPLINVEHFGLINLIAGKRIAAELIQDDLSPKILASELRRLLDPAANLRSREDLRDAAGKLGEGGASARAAEAVLNVVSSRDSTDY